MSCLVIAVACALASAATPDPLAFVPAEAVLVVKVEKPRQFVEALTALDADKGYENLPAVRDAFDTATAKQLFQLLKMAEMKLNKKWPDLLDKLAGGGIAVGTLATGDNAPTVLVAQGTDEKLTGEAFKLIMELYAAVKPEVGEVKGAEAIRVGNDFFAFRHKTTLVVSNKKQAAEKALSLVVGEKGAKSVLSSPHVPAARKMLGDPLAWVWYDLKKAKEDKAFSDFVEAASKQGAFLFLFGSTVDAIRRADFVTAGVLQTQNGFKLSVLLPAKRADLPPVMALHVPPKSDTPGTLPLLEPPGVLASHSMYLDVAAFWKQRKTALGEQELKDLEAFQKQISAFLPNTTLGELIEASGPHHRTVLVERGQNQYKTVPDFPLPEMAVVSSMRDAKFGKSMLTTVRTAAVLIGLQVGGLTLKEEKNDGIDILTYRFADEKVLASDSTNIRYNFVPSFAVVGDQFVAASSPKLLKDLIPEVKKPIDPKACSPAVWRAKGYGTGAAQALRARPDATISGTVLSQGVGLDEAKKQLERYAEWVGTLGTVGVSIDHGETAFKFEVDWQLKK